MVSVLTAVSDRRSLPRLMASRSLQRARTVYSLTNAQVRPKASSPERLRNIRSQVSRTEQMDIVRLSSIISPGS